MTEKYLIRNTTREERTQIVRSALGLNDSDAGSSCDAMIGEDGAFEFYQPYIDGEMEIDELNRRYRARWMRDMEAAERGGCTMQNL